jgi:uncharacterized membrane protein
MEKRWIDRLNHYIKVDKYTAIAFLISVIFAVIFSIFSVIQYYSVGTSAYDLGINAQELWEFIHTGSFYTPLLNENLLAEHFAIFKFLQVPLYYLFPSPITLMIFEDMFIALGGYIVYLIAVEILKNRIKSSKILFMISMIFLFSYEMSPYVQSLVSFSFHNMAFLPFFLLLAFYSFLTEKRSLQIVSILFIISLHANFVYIVIILILYEFFYLHTQNGNKIKTWLYKGSKAGGVKDFTVMIIFIALLYGYLVMAGIIKLHIAGVSSYSLVPSTGETGTTVTSPLALLLLIFTKPGEFASIIDSNSGMKIFYLNFMVKSLGYMPLFSPLSLIMYIPYILYAIPSSYSSYYQLGYQYSAMVVGAMYISAIAGFYNIIRLYDYVKKYFKEKTKKRIKIIFEGNKGEKNIVHICLVIILVVVIVMMPFGLLSPPQIQHLPHGSEMTDLFEEHTSGTPGYLIRLSGNISQSSYILTENCLMPYFSNHLHIYAAPFSPGYYDNLSEFQYIVIKNNTFWATQGGNHSLQRITDMVLANGSFSILSTYRPGDILVLQNNKIKSN